MLAVADANGLIDIAWLHHCPLLAPLRGTAELARVRASTAVRVTRVHEALSEGMLRA